MVTKLFPGKKIKDFLRASSAIVGKGTDHKLRALPFLHLDSFALYAAFSARLAFFALCYRAIACFLLFKTKGSSRVNTVIKSFCCSFLLPDPSTWNQIHSFASASLLDYALSAFPEKAALYSDDAAGNALVSV